jgi:hypothetical protein
MAQTTSLNGFYGSSGGGCADRKESFQARKGVEQSGGGCASGKSQECVLTAEGTVTEEVVAYAERTRAQRSGESIGGSA